MRKFLFLFGFLFILTGCTKVEPDLSNADSDIEEAIMENTEIKNFVEEISYEIGEELIDDEYDDYTVNIIFQVKNSFANLTQKDQLEVLYNSYNYFDPEKWIDCGAPDCRLGLFIAKHDNNEYKLQNGNLYVNGKEEFTWEQVREGNSEISEKNKSIEDEVYEYMKNAYNEITNNGLNYIPEEHDSLIAKMAAEKFRITEQEAGDIYINREMGY